VPQVLRALIAVIEQAREAAVDKRTTAAAWQP
jgi:hypothetical protein